MEVVVLKIAGCVLIVCGCLGIGGYAAVQQMVRIRVLRDLERMLQYLYGEIEYAATDMAEIMEYLAFRGGAFGEFCLNMRNSLLSHQGLRFSDYWEREMQYIQGFESLREEDRELLVQIGGNLGNMDRMTQLKTLEIFQKRLSGILLLAEKEYHGKVKIRLVIGGTVGIFLTILLF